MKKIISLIAAAALLLSFASICFAVDIFTPSAERGGAPAIVYPNIPGHANAIAGVYDEETGRLLAVVENGELNVIAYASKNTTNTAAREKLDAAYSEIMAAKSLGDLIPGLGDARTDVEPDEYVAKAFFDLDAMQDIIDFLNANPKAYLEVTFDTKYQSASQVPTVAFNCGNGWELVAPKHVRFNASNGSITVRFYKLCPIMLLLPDDGRLLIADGHVVSPGTVEEPSYGWILTLSAVVMASAATAFVVSTKKRHA